MRYEAVLDGKINCLEEGGKVVIIVYGEGAVFGGRRGSGGVRDAVAAKAE